MLLPCNHTVCRACSAKLSKSIRVCSECGEEHFFPENLKGNSILIQELKKCIRHGKESEFYCNEKECKVSICTVCLVEDHIGHDVHDRQEEQKGIEHKKEIQALVKKLDEYRNKLEDAKSEEETTINGITESISNEKEELSKAFDQKLVMLKKIKSCLECLLKKHSATDFTEEIRNLEIIKSGVMEAFKDPFSYSVFDVFKRIKILNISTEKQRSDCQLIEKGNLAQ